MKPLLFCYIERIVLYFLIDQSVFVITLFVRINKQKKHLTWETVQ